MGNTKLTQCLGANCVMHQKVVSFVTAWAGPVNKHAMWEDSSLFHLTQCKAHLKGSLCKFFLLLGFGPLLESSL